MKKTGKLLLLLFFIIVALAIFYYINKNTSMINPTGKIIDTPRNTYNYSLIKIASFNSQIFGDSKLQKFGVDYYKGLISDYDIFILQEIRDDDGNSFNQLCNSLSDYKCFISSRAGRSSSKEQYGVFYKKDISVDFKDYNPDCQDRWERPPLEADLNISGYELTLYTIHTKPEDTPKEINNLRSIVKSTGNVIILGDLNADCSYYDNSKNDDFDSWKWVINDNEDTTTGNTNCAYDRIIMNNDASNDFMAYGIDKNITKEISDHYLVWVELKTNS